MTFAVRYYTKTGNTKRLAESVAQALIVCALAGLVVQFILSR